MESRIMQVFYGNDCLPYKDKERTVHYPIVGNDFQGSSNYSKIRFYFERIGDPNATWVATSKLPNGKKGSKILQVFTDEEIGEKYALLELSSFYTQCKGDLFITLQGYKGGVIRYDEDNDLYYVDNDQTIIATGTIKLSINYATQFIGSGEEENVDLQEIMGALGTKLNINSGILVYDSVPTQEDVNNFDEGQIIYVKQPTNKFYKVQNSQLVEYLIFNQGDTYLTTEQNDYVIPPEDR